ncbi:carbohydrate ABC transporter permease [Paenibacillus eucommiae]|uniref:ABC-type glycerol-3-phosphate transport system permease component n=1 Tax=Paenibacillus eucommiae TaxID=1355755 RepID=A0ABS4ISU1_9BACL|nr:carbohydrate ABC transporter permease [Paenibacillus eucommiae]MBP1990649.1 ABC-type glycerol-3-phosphate transport system permease component [Paenibacillus eucommiae]
MIQAKPKMKISSLFVYIGLIVIAVFSIFPVIWMMGISLKPVTESVAGFGAMYTSHPTWQNFASIFKLMPFWHNAWNSVFTTLVGMVSTLFFCSLAGFAFAKFQFPGRNVLFYVVIATMLIPLEVGIVPLFIIMRKLELINSLWSLIIPKAATAVGIFYMRQYIMAVPTEILESAKMDGCSDFRTYRSIILPIIKPALASWAALTVIARWNDFFWPLIFLRTKEKFTLMVSISLLPVSEGLSTPWPVIMAGTSMAVIPIMLLYFIFQRYQVAGLSSGAVKG